MRISVLASTAFLLGSALTLTACFGGGGGGGGGGGSASAPVPFTSWNDVAPNTSVAIPGSGKESSYTYDLAAGQVTSLAPFSDVAANVTVRYNDVLQPTRIAIQTSQTSVSWDVN